MTLDEGLAQNLWTGDFLTWKTRMAEYTVDGLRLGGICWKPKSAKPDNVALDKTATEVLTAASMLSVLGYEHVAIKSVDSKGVPLEKPDLDVDIDGSLVGIECADVLARPQHDAMIDRIKNAFEAALKSDPAIADALGDSVLSVNLNPTGGSSLVEITGTVEADQLIADILALVRSKLPVHDGPLLHEPVPQTFRALASRGAEFNISPGGGPSLLLGEGAARDVDAPQNAEVLRVLTKHCESAKTNYRRMPQTWLFLFMPDYDEFIRRTAEVVKASAPSIAPFNRCFIGNSMGSVLELS